jgi:hypothetical protein
MEVGREQVLASGAEQVSAMESGCERTVVGGLRRVVVEEEEEDEGDGFKNRSWEQINEGLTQLCEVQVKPKQLPELFSKVGGLDSCSGRGMVRSTEQLTHDAPLQHAAA